MGGVTSFTAVGRISGAVGLHGEVKVTQWTDAPQRFVHLTEVALGSHPGESRICRIERVRITGSTVVLKFEGIDQRTQAEECRGQWVLVPDDQVVKPAEGSFFIDDVLGMDVVTEEGKRVGVVREVLRLPSNDLWQIESGPRMISIPAVKEFIRKVDVRSRTIVIHEIEGLLDA